MKMPKAVIFDMDGLMIDSERVTYEGYQELCQKEGVEMDLETYRKCLGKPVPAIWQVFFDAYGDDFPIERIMKENHARMADIFETEGVPLKEGLKELLSWLNQKNIPCVLATSSTRSRVDKILARAELTYLFKGSVCGDEVSKGKPDPEIFLAAAAKAGADAEDCLVLEDSEMGILAAADGKIPVICVPDMKYPANEYEKRCTEISDSLLDVLQLLKAESEAERPGSSRL